MTLAYIPITLTNNESTATATSFQQLLQNINMRDYFQFLNPDLSNTYFSSDSAGSTVINSWIESGNTNISTDTTFWVVTSVAANSTTTVYLQVDLSGTNHFNTTTTGAAPQLTSTYAEYDNGADVFTNYWNFAGTSSTGWTTSGTGSGTFNNGLTLNSNGQGPFLTSTTTLSSGNVIEGLMSQQAGAGIGIGTVSGYVFDMGESGTQELGIGITSSSGEVTGWVTTGSSVTAGTNYVITGYYTSSGNLLLNYVSELTGSLSPSTQDIVISGYSSSALTSFIQWLRTRAYPPNGVMPSVSLGTPSGFPYVNTTSSVTEVLDF